eukprot:3884661-Rhodomonas_salina.1
MDIQPIWEGTLTTQNCLTVALIPVLPLSLANLRLVSAVQARFYSKASSHCDMPPAAAVLRGNGSEHNLNQSAQTHGEGLSLTDGLCLGTLRSKGDLAWGVITQSTRTLKFLVSPVGSNKVATTSMRGA